jgi:uncharacterized protein YcaQ
MSPAAIPLSAARTLALHAQGLAAPDDPSSPATPERILAAVERIGCVQIDTLQMVQRSQYLTVWSRVGSYDPADFDGLMSSPPDGPSTRRLFEYWLHAACIIPLADFRYRLPVMHHYRRADVEHWNKRWLAENGNAHLLDEVRDRIARQGPQRASDFEHDGQRGGSWWNWKPAKRALEVLYDQCVLMVAGRVNFQRVYDLAERVLPDWVDTAIPSHEEMQRALVERGAHSFGICQPLQTAEYAYLKRNQIRPILKDLVAQGVLAEVEVTLHDGSTTGMVVHRDHQEALAQILDGALAARRTTFLSPFDNLFWPNKRDQQFWGVEQRLEAYKPAPQRIWGYYCLPIVHRDRVVGRFDPKLERKTGTLRLKALVLEPGIAPDDELVADVAAAMRDFLRFHQATELVIERCDPPEFGPKLLAAL